MIADNVYNQGDEIDKKVLSLYEVTQNLEQTIRKEYPNSFYLRAEISKLNLYKYSGHAYPELVEKKDGKIVAQIKAIIWQGNFNRINEKFINIVGQPLQDGILIVCKATFTYNSLYGLSLIISDIDPYITLGELEKERKECINKLNKENIFNLNSTLNLPILPQRLAIISVATSKGYSDFIQTLKENKHDYDFFYYLFPSLLQGDKAEKQMIDALDVIDCVKDFFDCVLIIRGGGGDIGLSCYNNYELCRKIATFSLPILTGIGHSTNETVAEMISYQNCITPTALANFILERFDGFYNNILGIEQRLIKSAYDVVDNQKKDISHLAKYLKINAYSIISQEKQKLVGQEKYLNAMNPMNLLNKGYSITLLNDKIVMSKNQVKSKDKIRTITKDGEFTSTVD
ncbi:MAG: exodeoxyribonuclease VII large subunit [Bacteroidales bacterium]|jgi:exodeoxyribonuclease VII large subunit|nr:exodeoxyribonuclease VII large subunit [Bacteroidales bacterium]